MAARNAGGSVVDQADIIKHGGSSQYCLLSVQQTPSPLSNISMKLISAIAQFLQGSNSNLSDLGKGDKLTNWTVFTHPPSH